MFNELGMPATVGQLKELLQNYPDGMHFGFRNQPQQVLIYEENGKYKGLAFQEVWNGIVTNLDNLSLAELQIIKKYLKKDIDESGSNGEYELQKRLLVYKLACEKEIRKRLSLIDFDPLNISEKPQAGKNRSPKIIRQIILGIIGTGFGVIEAQEAVKKSHEIMELIRDITDEEISLIRYSEKHEPAETNGQ